MMEPFNLLHNRFRRLLGDMRFLAKCYHVSSTKPSNHRSECLKLTPGYCSLNSLAILPLIHQFLCEKPSSNLSFHCPILFSPLKLMINPKKDLEQVQVHHYVHSNAMFTIVAMGIQGEKEGENIVIPSTIFSQVDKPIRKSIYFALVCSLSRLVRKVSDNKHVRSTRTS